MFHDITQLRLTFTVSLTKLSVYNLTLLLVLLFSEFLYPLLLLERPFGLDVRLFQLHRLLISARLVTPLLLLRPLLLNLVENALNLLRGLRLLDFGIALLDSLLFKALSLSLFKQHIPGASSFL